MPIEGCPTCGGDGWIAVERPGRPTRPFRWYEERGYLTRVVLDTGMEMTSAGPNALDLLDKEGGQALVFKLCWCHRPVVQTAQQMGQPLYWMQDQGGQVRGPVERFLTEAELSEADIEMLKGYIAQWVDMLQREGVKRLTGYEKLPPTEWLVPLANARTREDINDVWDTLIRYGIDPL